MSDISTSQEKPKGIHPFWFLIILLAVVGLAFAGIVMWKEQWITSPLDGRPNWVLLVPALSTATTFVGGIAGAYFVQWQLNRTYLQREHQYQRQITEFEVRHEADRKQFEMRQAAERIQFEARQEADRKQFEEMAKETQALITAQQNTFREQFEAKAKAEQIQFEQKHLEEQFNDIQNRLSSQNPATRANAALRLAQLAEMPLPGSETGDNTLTNNPFFPRAASQLSIAINMEKDSGVHAAIVEGIHNLTDFAANKHGGEHLHYLIRTLADANRTALAKFSKAAVAYWVTVSSKDTAEDNLSVFASLFGQDFEMSKHVIRDLMKPLLTRKEDKLQRNLYNRIDATEQTRTQTEFIMAVQNTAAQLLMTRDALALCLRCNNSSEPFDLHSTYLAGANLEEAHIRTSDLKEAYLQKANIKRTNFEGSRLDQANLHQAAGEEVILRHTSMRGCNADEASLRNADFQETDLRNVSFRFAKLQHAQFEDANLMETVLYHAEVAFSTLDHAQYVDKSWHEADFFDIFHHDEALTERLEAKFPLTELEAANTNTEITQAAVETFEDNSPMLHNEQHIFDSDDVYQTIGQEHNNAN